MELILSVLVELVTVPIKQYIVTPITRHIGYAFKCNSKVQTLQDEVMQLKNKKDRLQQSVDGAIRNGEEIYPNVTNWLSIVDKAIGDAEQLVQQKEEEAKKRCLVGLCPNLKTRYQFSKNAERKASAIDKLQNEHGLDSISFRSPLQQIVEPSVYIREALPSRVSMLNQIMDALRDPNLNMIGVYGMGGVGKTTLSKEVQAKAIQEKLFETVVLVAVSQTPELRRIQAEIADFLGLKFDVEELPGRASQLYRRLENSKVLIILDDLWQKLDLNAIGIPSGSASTDSKIMLTSRSKYLLSSEMRALRLFALEVLGEDETWRMFEMSVAEAKDPKLHAIATEVAKKCAGLPLLIELVATELQNQESYVWNDKLHQLSTFGDEEIYERVYKVLESSYDTLPGKEAKSFFLLCAMFGQSNIRIQYLLTHSMGLGLFKHVRTVEGARDKVFTLIDKLKDKSLLRDGDMIGFVKMHDIVRDTALSIASREQHAFIASGETRLSDWPNKDCTRISFPYCDIHDVPIGLDCPEAELLLLFTEDLCLEIPDSFFERIRKLKVLDFTGMRLVSLPSSFAFLTNLQTLSLHTCRLDNVAIVGELKQLELLSFAGSKIVEFPREIEALTRLKLLDLRNCSDLKVIPESVLSKLCSLEELYILNSFVRWNAKGNASLVELDNLSHLSILEIQIANSKLISQSCNFFDGLKSYKISIGDKWGWQGGDGERSKTLKLMLDAGIQLKDGIQVLFSGTEDLYLSNARGIESVLHDLDRKGFPQLKQLHIRNDNGIRLLIKSTTGASCHAFPILESLDLNNLKSLEKICYGQLEIGSFGELRILKISRCDKLKRLFSLSSVKCLQQLREMEVESCGNIEAIVGQESEDQDYNNELIELNQFVSLKLKTLPHLKGFRKITEPFAPGELLLFNEMVSFPNLTSLEVYKCNSLRCVFTASMVKCLVQLKKLVIRDCELMEEIIQSKKNEETEENINMIVFPKLDQLSLIELRNVKGFSCRYSIEFSLLKELVITDCRAMKNFASKFSSNESEEEYLFNEMVTFSNLETMVITFMNFKYLWDEQVERADDDSFSKLKSLVIRNCSKLSVVFPSNSCRRFQGLEALKMHNCGGVEEIYQYEGINFKEMKNVEAFSLRDLQINCLGSLKNIWSKDPCGAFTFGNLQSVDVESCKYLKYVFPTSIVRGLLQLQKLKIKGCNVEAIISMEKDERSSDHSFQFPELTTLELFNLKEMRTHAFECPNLKSLYLQGWNISLQKFIGNLEELGITGRGLNAIIQQSGEFSVYKLKKLTLYSLEEESSIPVVFAFLRRLKYLEDLVFEFCDLEEILFDLDNERPNGDEQLHHLISLKYLELMYVGKLKHIVRKKDQFQVNHILQHLQTLHVKNCHDLMNIAPSSASFKNLTTLRLEYCYNITNLVTASTAKTMVHLMELKVENCNMIVEIVAKDDGDDMIEHDHEITFNKLKRLELDGLPKFNSFCSNIYTFSFPLLEQVSVKTCPRMEIFCGGDLSTPKLRGILFQNEQQWEGNLNATIASQLREWVGEHLDQEAGIVLENVESLGVVKDAICSKAILADQMQLLNKLRKISVRDCESVQVVFDLEGLSDEGGHAWLLPQLEELNLVNLPVLRQLCNKSPRHILDFNKLKVLKIDNISGMKYVFTWSMASRLFQLKMIQVKNCEMLETLIIRNTSEEEAEDAVAEVICIGSLESIVLECLPKFSSIYSGTKGVLECSSLKKISIRKCPSIKSFISKLIREDRQGKEESRLIHFNNKVFPKLEEFSLDTMSISAILQIELPTNFFSTVKNLELRYCSATTISHFPLVHFLSRLPNVVELLVSNSSVEELFKCEGLGRIVPLHIRALKLVNLDSLKQILWWQISHEFPVSSSAPFLNLTTLIVYGCNRLRNLITSSVAKSMIQLETLIVKSCNMLMEIVADRNDGTTEEVVFTKMKKLELDDLLSLRSFSLGNCSFIFPCLVEVVVRNCPNLRVFCPGNMSTPMLNFIWIDFCCKGNQLNNTIEEMYKKMGGFKYLKYIKLSLFPILKEFWGGQCPFKCFVALERLVVNDCATISNAIPTHLLEHLKELKVLIVEKCHLVECVFDLEGGNATQCGIKRMENINELQLIDLPKLIHVWSKDPQQILSFKNLQMLKILNCGSLTFIFNLSMASRLANLQHLEVKECSLVEHIIAKEEEENMQEYQTVFPSLQSMSLQRLTNLSSFYSATGFLVCPSLKMIEAAECPKMELFSAFSSEPDSSMIAQGKEESISNEIVFLGTKIGVPGLEELKLEWNSLKGILYGDIQPEFLHRLKCIELTGFQDEQHAILPSNFLQHFPKLEKLAVSDASIEEVNLQELSILKGKDPESLALLTKLKLSYLTKLKYLVHDESQLVPLFRILEDLEVCECSRLKIIVPSSVSFINLTNLEVSKCDGLTNLMTASTARSLVQLRRMNVKDCKKVQEIIAKSSDEVEYEIRFSQLEYLGFDDLPCLTSFSSGNFDFHFPSLKEVMVKGCRNMSIFTEQVPTAPKLRKVRTGIQDYEWEWEGSINNTIQALFPERACTLH